MANTNGAVWRGALAITLVACSGGSATGAGDDDDDDAGPAPITARCQDPGPDAPVEAQVASTLDTFEGDPVQWYLPEGLRAVVFYFYGGEHVSEWNGPEQIAFQNQMADAGIGWIAYTKGTPGRGAAWQTETNLSENVDIQRLQRLRDHLVATTPLETDTPIVSTGFSDGAAFSVFFASATQQQFGWPIAAVSVHNSGARGIALPDAPLWATSSDHDDPSTRDGAEELAAEQAARGFEAAYRRVSERTLLPEVLLRHAEWDEAKTLEMFQEMVDLGLVDAAGQRLVPDDQIEQAVAAYGNNSIERGSAIASSRVRVVWATHRYSAVHTAEECAFVLGALGL